MLSFQFRDQGYNRAAVHLHRFHITQLNKCSICVAVWSQSPAPSHALVCFILLWQTSWANNIRMKGFIVAYTSTSYSIIEGSQGRNLEAGTEAETTGEYSPTCLLPVASFACFLCAVRELLCFILGYFPFIIIVWFLNHYILYFSFPIASHPLLTSLATRFCCFPHSENNKKPTQNSKNQKKPTKMQKRKRKAKDLYNRLSTYLSVSWIHIYMMKLIWITKQKWTCHWKDLDLVDSERGLVCLPCFLAQLSHS